MDEDQSEAAYYVPVVRQLLIGPRPTSRPSSDKSQIVHHDFVGNVITLDWKLYTVQAVCF